MGHVFQHALPLLLQNKVRERKTICKSCWVRTDYRCKNRYDCCWLSRKEKKKRMPVLLNMGSKEKLAHQTNKTSFLFTYNNLEPQSLNCAANNKLSNVPNSLPVISRKFFFTPQLWEIEKKTEFLFGLVPEFHVIPFAVVRSFFSQNIALVGCFHFWSQLTVIFLAISGTFSQLE